MKKIRRLINILIIILSANSVFLFECLAVSWLTKWFLGSLFFILFSFVFWVPFIQQKVPVRLQIMMGGHELAIEVIWTVCIQIIMSIAIGVYGGQQIGWNIAGNVFAMIVIWIMWINGILRMIFSSKQAKLFFKIAVLLLWWVPGLSIYWTYKLLHSVHTEYFVECSKIELDTVRAENQICQTRYPIIMVHGVFFRDWQLFQYWGRIPEALMKNGATIYYGNQQSAAPVAESAHELKEQIMAIIQENHYEKVNIIAHSKGGLDSRYAISCLGLAPYVASLTTINTPHRGCIWAEKVLQKVPDRLLKHVAKRYDKLFTILGDKKPDFVSAVTDLTQSHCMQLNVEASNISSVFYQSSMSIMKRNRSDGFPLNILHFFIKRIEGDNDGLVSVDSSRWGYELGVMKSNSVRGISHGDMIDLKRENIKGFDVREFYVNLVMNLKLRGF